MTRAAASLLLYLDRYVAIDPKTSRAKFHAVAALYQKTTNGKTLHFSAWWKHVKRKVEPNMSTTLVYLDYLIRAGELTPDKSPGALFTYRNPKYIKK